MSAVYVFYTLRASIVSACEQYVVEPFSMARWPLLCWCHEPPIDIRHCVRLIMCVVVIRAVAAAVQAGLALSNEVVDGLHNV